MPLNTEHNLIGSLDSYEPLENQRECIEAMSSNDFPRFFLFNRFQSVASIDQEEESEMLICSWNKKALLLPDRTMLQDKSTSK